MVNDRDWSEDKNWADRILELFDAKHIPRTAHAKEMVALFILGKNGGSRKTPSERVADFNAEAERFVGKEVKGKRYSGTISGTVEFLSVMSLEHRVSWSERGSYSIGPFAAYIGSYYAPTSRLEIIESPATSE